MDRQEGPTVQHRELYSLSCDEPNGKEYEKECIYICTDTDIYISESLCCTVEINTTL